MSGKAKANDHPHIGLAVLSSGAMALGLAGGLQFLGLMRRLDDLVGRLLSPRGMDAPALALDPLVTWLAAAALAFALPALVLNVPGLWRRLVIWGGTVALTITWGPVLILASHKPEIGVALVAVLWSGFCAIFYTTNHILPADMQEPNPQQKENNGPR